MILALILICHCSYRGIVELLRDLFDYSLSIGTIHNRVIEAVQKARKINQSQDLSSIEVALLDELFQGNQLNQRRAKNFGGDFNRDKFLPVRSHPSRIWQTRSRQRLAGQKGEKITVWRGFDA